MIEALNELISALREELQHYGEMLALLDQQQECAMARLTDQLLNSVNAIQAQAGTIQQARQRREERHRVIARELCLAESSTFVETIPLLPVDYQPLLESLVEENNSLLRRIQERARQNHLLLSRTVEMMHQFISALFPQTGAPVYNERGTRLAPVVVAQPLYEAVG